MGFHLEHDAPNGIFLLKFEGKVTDRVILDAFDTLKKCWDRFDDMAYISDCTQVTEVPVSAETIEAIADHKPVIPPTFYIIVVAPQGVVYALSRMFQVLTVESRPTFQVVHTMDDALKLMAFNLRRSSQLFLALTLHDGEAEQEPERPIFGLGVR